MWSALGLLIDAALDWLERTMLGGRRDAVAHDDAVGRGRAEAASETSDVTKEIADEQVAAAADPGPDGADALAAELRARAARLAAGGRGRVGA